MKKMILQRRRTQFNQHWIAFFLALIWLGIALVQFKILVAYQWQEKAGRHTISDKLFMTRYTVKGLAIEVWGYGIGGCICILCNIGIFIKERIFRHVPAYSEKSSLPKQNRWQSFLFILIGFYVTSFGVFYTLDGAFTHLLGTTPYCNPHPIFKIYQPLAQLIGHIGWYGGGELVETWWR